MVRETKKIYEVEHTVRKQRIHSTHASRIFHRHSLQSGLDQANRKLTPYYDGLGLHGPTNDDVSRPDLLDVFRTVAGDMKYLADWTRPDLEFIFSRLGGATHAPTELHWIILKEAVRYVQEHELQAFYIARLAKKHPSRNFWKYSATQTSLVVLVTANRRWGSY